MNGLPYLSDPSLCSEGDTAVYSLLIYSHGVASVFSCLFVNDLAINPYAYVLAHHI